MTLPKPTRTITSVLRGALWGSRTNKELQPFSKQVMSAGADPGHLLGDKWCHVGAVASREPVKVSSPQAL